MSIQKRKIHFIWGIVLACLVIIALCISLFYDGGRKNTGKVSEVQTEELLSEPIELELVYAYQNAQWNSAIENTVQSFEEMYPHIHINYEVNYEHKVYEDILGKKIARNELGDIVQLKTPEAYAAGGLLGTISDDVTGLVTSAYKYNEKTYGIGAVQATSGIIYNKDIFKTYGLSEPKTYGEFMETCSALKMQGITPIGIGGGDLWHMEFWVNHFFRTDVLMKNEHWLEDCMQGKVTWLDPEPVAMMQHLYELFHSGYVNDNWILALDSTLSYQMSEGEIAMIYTGPWTEATIRTINPDMNLGWFYVPDENGIICAGDNMDTFWSVTAECKQDKEKYEAAMTFLAYFYSQPNYAQLCRSTDTFSLAREDVSYDMTGIQEDILESFQNADKRISIYIGNENTPEEFERAMLSIVLEVLSDGETVEEGLVHIQEMWDWLKVQEAGA